MIEEMLKFLLDNTDFGRKYARENELGRQLGNELGKTSREPVKTSVKSGKTSRETGETGPETGKTSREPVEYQSKTSPEPVEMESNRA
jgi:hypothetical protein